MRSKVQQIDGQALVDLLRGDDSNYQYLDVRTPMEYTQGKIEGFKNIPLQVLKASLDHLDRSKPVVVICATGSRSNMAARILSKADFKQVLNVRGGLSVFA